MPNTAAPFDTHLYANPHGPRQRYFGPDVLNWNVRNVAVQFPATVNGRRFNIENFIVCTVFATVTGVGAGVQIVLGAYDIDEATLLRTDVLGAVAPGNGVFDFGTGSSGLLRGRIFRVHDLRVGTQNALENFDVTLRLRARSA